MLKKIFFSVALFVAATSQIADGQTSSRPAVPAVAAATPRPARAVLRYDLSSAGACRAFTDQPAELCLLLALHVIHMSEHPPKAL